MKKIFKAKLNKFSKGSHFILIPLQVRRDLEIFENDILSIEIEKIEDKESLIKDYRCNICSLEFSSDDDIPYCPGCENTNLEEMKGGIEND